MNTPQERRYIIGIDPATRNVGYTVLDEQSGEVVEVGCWQLKGKTADHRMVYLHTDPTINEWRERYGGRIAAVGVEKQYTDTRSGDDADDVLLSKLGFSDNKKSKKKSSKKSTNTGLIVAESRGWVKFMLVGMGARVFYDVYPTQAKAAVAWAGATKEDVIRSVEREGVDLSHIAEPVRENAADSYAIARFTLAQNNIDTLLRAS